RAKETRDRADQESAEQLQRVQETATKMLERAATLEAELNTLVMGIHDGAGGLVESLRAGAGDMETELASIRQELITIRPEPEPEPEPELTAATEQFDELPPTPEPTANGASHEPEPVAETAAPEPEAPPPATRPPTPAGPEGARLVALNMALNGTPREEAARYLADNFQLDDQEAILDDVYSRVGGRA
ncbi:MAG TPA: hypothetical protein VGI67_16120, partial [Thermoleophilaceae bacterium]